MDEHGENYRSDFFPTSKGERGFLPRMKSVALPRIGMSRVVDLKVLVNIIILQ